MNTANQIIKYLNQNQSATVDELSQALDLTKADIHYHMRKLKNNGEVRVCGIHSPKSAGRPARLYELVATPPLALSRLLVSQLLLVAPRSMEGSGSHITLAEYIADLIIGCCPSLKTRSKSPSVRLNILALELETLGFRIHWIAARKGPQIHFEYEPLSLLIDNPDLVKKILSSLADRILMKTA